MASFKQFTATSMNFAISCLLFGIFITLQSSAVESLSFDLWGQELCFQNGRIPKPIPSEYNITSCGGISTHAPGRIIQRFEYIEIPDLQCTWTIKAPVGYSVYFSKYCTDLTSFRSSQINNLANYWVDLKIYEGYDTLSGKPLFNSKRDVDLNKSVSKGQALTVVFKYSDPGNFTNEISLEYGFVKQSLISDLLN